MPNQWDTIKANLDAVIKNDPTTKIRGDVLNTQIDTIVDALKALTDAANGLQILISALDDTTATPNNGDAIIYNTTSGEWEYGTPSGSGIPGTTFDAKGDIIAGTADDSYSALTVGANDTMLVADSAESTGLKWAAASVVKTLLAITGIDLNNDDTVQALTDGATVAWDASSGIVATLTSATTGTTINITNLADGAVAQVLINSTAGDIDDISDTGGDISTFYAVNGFGYGDITWASGRVLLTVYRIGSEAVYSFIPLVAES